jgi:hypothetical protein
MNKISLFSWIALLIGMAPFANAQRVKCTSPDGQSSTIQKHHCSSPTDIETPTTINKQIKDGAEAVERWEFSFASPAGNTFRDLNSIKRSGNFVTIREKVEFFQPQHSITANPPYEYKSVVSTFEYDCVNNTARTLNTINISTNREKKPSEIMIINAMPLIGSMVKNHHLACASN